MSVAFTGLMRVAPRVFIDIVCGGLWFFIEKKVSKKRIRFAIHKMTCFLYLCLPIFLSNNELYTSSFNCSFYSMYHSNYNKENNMIACK